jgi:hypothetical protein
MDESLIVSAHVSMRSLPFVVDKGFFALRFAEAGCTTEQIKSFTGHRTDDMAAYYARQAN